MLTKPSIFCGEKSTNAKQTIRDKRFAWTDGRAKRAAYLVGTTFHSKFSSNFYDEQNGTKF